MLQICHSTYRPHPEVTFKAQQALDILLQRKDLGFTRVPSQLHWISDIEKKSAELKSKYKKFVIVGFGGSSLGARAIQEIFDVKSLFFVDNVDAIALDRTLKFIQPSEDVLWLFVSKSGNTIEILFLLDVLRERLAAEGLDLVKNSMVISEDEPNPLRTWAKKHDRPCFDFPKDIGGRFSVLSGAGMLPAALGGLNIKNFYDGALEALDTKDLVVQMTAQFYESFQREEWITQFWFYNSSMFFFSRWLIQLWSESLAKKKNRQGGVAPRCSTPMGCMGSTDQHSVLQQVVEGARDKFVVFHSFEKNENSGQSLSKFSFSDFLFLQNKKMGDLLREQVFATEESLRSQGVSTLLVRSKVLDEKNLGFLFMLYELVVGSLGEMMDINAYDQPGVELGKRLTLKRLTNL